MAEGTFHKGLILHKTVVFVGMMGAGKTAVGRTLAARLGVKFRDSDHEIEVAAQMNIAEIFARDGEDFFRRKESQIIGRLLDGAPGVLSTGGGAFMSEANRKMISARGVSVWLNADLELLWDRVRQKDTRPLLKTEDPKGTLRGLYDRRVPIYALADLAVRSEPGMSLEKMAARVADALLAERPDVLEERP
ncbi:MAG: shikimate kinase [Sagittula sp.]|jgi:shikimate kinase|uniref:shikimate kinase n=1 Tax=unclassified Sagittula TaxID=2624628 RepID=UPI000C2D4A5C|nr:MULTISPECIES: shikimate kinase [unclassified Sagittula]AUC55068.1 shikimate kinase [Sagittula sp. P11]WHZ33531.1 shikimate kinase [Sagittula sp. MA-2]